MAGEDVEVGDVLGCDEQLAEGDVVAGGVLDAGDDAFAAQPDQEVGGKLEVGADGDVVGEDGMSTAAWMVRKWVPFSAALPMA